MGSTSVADFLYFKLIYDYLNTQINTFGLALMSNLMTWASAVAMVLVTLWVMIQGYRIITGQSRESAMVMVIHSMKVVVIVFIATTMGIFGANLHQFFTTELSTGINELFGNPGTMAQTIDENLAWTQLALSAVDIVQIPPGDIKNIATQSHTALLAGLGTASPPMAAGAMLLLYQFTIAIFIGLGPLFILCLIFEQTKDLFRKWLMYGIGTLFSMAMLAVVTSICLQLSLRVAAALWASSTINYMTGLGAEGLSSQALQQGGVGLLLTVLIISVPPLASMFFQGTMGNFMFQSAFGLGGARAAAMQNGLPAGAYEAGGYGALANAGHTNSAGLSGAQAINEPNPNRMTGHPVMVQADTIKNQPTKRG